MSEEPYLILHKVRGKPAFDIAIRMKCPLCANGVIDCDDVMCNCGECGGSGYWWIIPTSGHRAYVSDYIQLAHLQTNMGEYAVEHMASPDDDLPDHYQYQLDRTPKSPIVSVDVQNALAKLIKPEASLVRRKL